MSEVKFLRFHAVKWYDRFSLFLSVMQLARREVDLWLT